MTLDLVNGFGGSGGNAATSRSKFEEDRQTFLTLLTTQLQSQNPLDPLDTNEFTAQLTQFSIAEQNIATNENLEKLIALTQASSQFTSFNYIGKDVELATDQILLGEDTIPLNLFYGLEANAETAEIQILNEDGSLAFKTDVAKSAGRHEFVWDGTDENGIRLPDGNYSFKVVAKDAEESTVRADVSFITNVVGILFDGNEFLLNLPGDTLASSLDVIRILNPSSSSTQTSEVTDTPSDGTNDENTDTNTQTEI